MKIPLRQPKVTILLWQVPQNIKLAGCGGSAKTLEEPAEFVLMRTKVKINIRRG